MMEELKILLRYAFQTNNDLTFPVSGPGSVGMESCFVNLVEPGDKVIVCVNGVFGNRLAQADPQRAHAVLTARGDVVSFKPRRPSTPATAEAPSST